VADVAGTVLAVREHLRALPYLDEITEVSVASAQSTKAVNLGMLLGTAEVAAESAIRLELIEVAHEPPVGSVVRHDQDRVAARLMHDDAVRQLATAALHRRNLRLASRALAEGSVRWDELRLRIDALQDLSIGVVEPWGAGNLLHTQLHFVERSSIDDPWLVVRRVCALCEAQVELATIKLARRRDHGVEGGISWLWKQRNEVGHQAKFEPPAERHLVAALAAVKDAFAPSGSVTATPPWRSPIGTIWGAEIDIGPTFLDDQCRAMIDSLDEA